MPFRLLRLRSLSSVGANFYLEKVTYRHRLALAFLVISICMSFNKRQHLENHSFFLL